MSREIPPDDPLDGEEVFYSDDQPRDENGRWAGGGADGKAAERARTGAQHAAAAVYHEKAAQALDKTHPAAAAGHREAAEDHRIASKATGMLEGGRAAEHARSGSVMAHEATKGAMRDGGKFPASGIAPGATQGIRERQIEANRQRARMIAHDAQQKLDHERGKQLVEGRARERAQLKRNAEAKRKAEWENTMDRATRPAILGKHGVDEEALDGNTVRLAFAAAVEVDDSERPIRVVDGVEYVVGKPIHIFPRGKWAAVDGRNVEFDEADADAMLADLATRHSDVALTFDHETDKARGSESAGWMPRDKFVWRADGLWNTEPLWVRVTYTTLLATGKFRYLSGDALGIGSARNGDAFHPRRLLAASLVPKPGFVRGLKGIQLAAETAAHAEETFMPKMTRAELCQKMGLSAEEFKSQLEEWAKEESDEHGLPDAEKAGALPAFLKKKKGDGTDEEASEGDDAKSDDETKEKEENMGAKNETPGTGDDKLVAEKFAALGKELADRAIAEATTAANESVTKTVEARFAAEARSKKTEDLLAAAKIDGRLTTANEPVFRETFAANAELGEKLLASLPKPAIAPGEALSAKNAFITGNGNQPMSREDLKTIFDNPEQDSRKYAAQGKFLTAVARFSTAQGIDPASAMSGVLRGENEALEREIFSAEDKTAEKFTGDYVGGFRRSQRQIAIDPEMVDFLKKRVASGKIPNQIIASEIQQFATIADFQPSAKTTLPMALGYFQSEFVGDEALPVFVGGADEKAAWPELFFEKFAAIAPAVGLLGSPAETSLNITWHTVTLDKYAVRGNIDRRARAASITLPRGIDTIMLENLKSQVGVTKEMAQAAFLTTNGNYYDSSYYPSVTAWSSAGTPAAYVGKPIDDIYAGMQHVRVGVRAWPDLLLLSPAAAAALRKNQQIIDTVRFTGTKADPGTGVSNQTIAALFAGLFNITIVVGEAGGASLPSGSPVTDVWGLDAWLLCTGKGQIEAPRFGMTVGAAGVPRVRAFPAEHLGSDGADALVYTDAWQLTSISKKAGYRMVGASAAI